MNSPGGHGEGEGDKITNSGHGSENTNDHRSPTSSNADKSSRRLMNEYNKAKKRLI